MIPQSLLNPVDQVEPLQYVDHYHEVQEDDEDEENDDGDEEKYDGNHKNDFDNDFDRGPYN